jgi:heptaprenyl diphosphate synthase
MNMTVKRLSALAVLAGTALIIFVLEAQLPDLIPVPGVKLGLSNVVTLFTLYTFGRRDGLLVLFTRVLLGGFFAGQLLTLLYSLSGGLLCFFVLALLRPLVGEKQLWFAGITGAVFHNVGQLLMAIFITRALAITAYFPVLVIAGVVTGLLTGTCTQLLLPRLRKIGILNEMINENITDRNMK